MLLPLHAKPRTGGAGQIADGPELRVAEICGLAHALDLTVIDAQTIVLRSLHAGTLIGDGKVALLAEMISERNIALLVIDHVVSPIQQRNLEKALQCKVIDRTGLILEIFGRRARTREGVLQVELARLEYERSRLVRTWTHLERQRGGLGKTGGPGETQLELDRRQIGNHITRLKTELSEVRRTRALHRAGRKRRQQPVIALVGYTNSGKSTLFNRLAEAHVLAKNMLFATLDPTMRAISLDERESAILVDTVGFIADLPTELVESFRATLEEVLEADLILHVRDIAHPSAISQKADVETILNALSQDHAEYLPPLLEIWNKMDLLAPSEQTAWREFERQGALSDKPLGIAISALTGEGLDRLIETLRDALAQPLLEQSFALNVANGEARAWIYAHAEVLAESTDDLGGLILHTRIRADHFGRYQKRFAQPV